MRPLKILELTAIGITLKAFLTPLIDALIAEGHDVTCCCSPDEASDELRARGYKVVNIEVSRSINPRANLRSVMGLYNLIKNERYDIVHVHTPVAALVGRLAARLAGVPVVIYTAHGFYFHERMSRLKYSIFLNIEKFAGRLLTDYIFTVSSEDRESAVKHGIIPQDRVFAISNGIDVKEKFNPSNIDDEKLGEIRKHLGIGQNDKVIAFVGRMVREKGILELIEAFNSMEPGNCKLLLVGDCPKSERDTSTHDEIISQVAKNKNIIMAGVRPDVNHMLALANLFVLPSHREGLPVSVIEAMSMGRPVVATDIRGCREEVVHGKTGFLFEAGNIPQLRQCITDILENPELEKSMGEKGRRRALELFDRDKVLERQMGLIQELIEKEFL